MSHNANQSKNIAAMRRSIKIALLLIRWEYQLKSEKIYSSARFYSGHNRFRGDYPDILSDAYDPRQSFRVQ
jgi:hypothetical protein